MVNTRKLRARVIECGMTYAEAAELMGMSAITFARKIRNMADISINEAVYLLKILEIPISEFANYFLCDCEE